MTRSAIIRIPKEDYLDIQKVAREMNLSMASAYKVWKNTKLMNMIKGWKNL